jgi:hypothetical protein
MEPREQARPQGEHEICADANCQWPLVRDILMARHAANREIVGLLLSRNERWNNAHKAFSRSSHRLNRSLDVVLRTGHVDLAKLKARQRSAGDELDVSFSDRVYHRVITSFNLHIKKTNK